MSLKLLSSYFEFWSFRLAERDLAQNESKTSSQSLALTLTPYTFENVRGEKVEAELGRLLVPENRRNTHSRKIEIAFVRFKSKANQPGPPVFYLEGGPGGSGIDAAKNQAFSSLMAMREFGDVVALDQRATGLSKPGLECSSSWDMPLDVPGEGEVARRSIKERITVCLEELKDEASIQPVTITTKTPTTRGSARRAWLSEDPTLGRQLRHAAQAHHFETPRKEYRSSDP